MAEKITGHGLTRLQIEDFEIGQLLEAIYFRYGYDFRNYARASLERKIRHRVRVSGLGSITSMTAKILSEVDFFELFLQDMSVTVTEMFRDPYVFKKIRESVFEKLKTYSRLNIWHVGCATGEEVYSMAVMLAETGLLKRTRIYATDYNNASLAIASKGIYPVDKIKHYSHNYQAAGGKASFADYYQVRYGSAKIKGFLMKHITFANHNLMKDQVFARMHLIVCRNVLIYFNSTLQDRVLKLFEDSLIHRGFLVLGDQESLDFSQVKDAFEVFAKRDRIYRKVAYV